MGAELIVLAIAGGVALGVLVRAPVATLCTVAAIGALVDHGVVPAPRLELVQRTTALRSAATARAVCERRVAVALLGEAAVSEQDVTALEHDCDASVP